MACCCWMRGSAWAPLSAPEVARAAYAARPCCSCWLFCTSWDMEDVSAACRIHAGHGGRLRIHAGCRIHAGHGGRLSGLQDTCGTWRTSQRPAGYICGTRAKGRGGHLCRGRPRTCAGGPMPHACAWRRNGMSTPYACVHTATQSHTFTQVCNPICPWMRAQSHTHSLAAGGRAPPPFEARCCSCWRLRAYAPGGQTRRPPRRTRSLVHLWPRPAPARPAGRAACARACATTARARLQRHRSGCRSAPAAGPARRGWGRGKVCVCVCVHICVHACASGASRCQVNSKEAGQEQNRTKEQKGMRLERSKARAKRGWGRCEEVGQDRGGGGAEARWGCATGTRGWVRREERAGRV